MNGIDQEHQHCDEIYEREITTVRIEEDTRPEEP